MSPNRPKWAKGSLNELKWSLKQRVFYVFQGYSNDAFPWNDCIYKNLFKSCKIKVNKLILNITEPILIA